MLVSRPASVTGDDFAANSDEHLHASDTRNWARLTAAILYVLAAGFFAVTLSVLTTTWGQAGLSQMLIEGHPARSTTLYMLVAGGFSLGAAFVLLAPVSLCRAVRVAMLASAGILTLTSLFFAPPSALVTVIPWVFLFRFHQERAPRAPRVTGDACSKTPNAI
ncbi:MAG: hypothetical protein IV085_06510 [Thiobacillus sp.]|nr:hypothetical protein [Thiobacillus sp.]